ncbi:serralysin [Rhizobium etli]|uniref:Serralysin n=1 Tax=Rhizobium etli TaxID=29449 RepID=A0A7W6VFT9_RHIET|nr:serralysin [Rhizobium etli]MBB4539363.1 serralysin [Rhizobium etli]
MLHLRKTSDDWWINDQTPDNPYGKSEQYESFIDHLGSWPSWLTPEIAAGTVRINLYELNNHPGYKAAAIGALEMWASVTPLKFEIIDDAPFDGTTDQIEVVSPELGEEDDGVAYSNSHHVSIGQGFDKDANTTDVGGYVFQTFMHEFGHEFGLDHPGDYNYSGPDGEPITYRNDATWIYDRWQYSVMSYFDSIAVGGTNRWFASTPLMADIEAVIRRHFSTVDANGVRTYKQIDINTEDNIYGFGSTQRSYQLTPSGKQHDIGFAIHDTGGIDTIDFSGSTAGTILDLRAGHFSSVNGCSNNVSIFAGHNADATDYYVENGIGSSHDDVLIGNDGANILDGRGGADRMAGKGGDDIYFVDSPDDLIREEANGGNDTVILLSKNLKIPQIANVEHIIYADELPGNDENILCGGAGEDTLTGGEGQEKFRFSTEFGNGNVDRKDMGLLDSLVFGSGGRDGALALGAFHGSAQGNAHNADDLIIYISDSGALSYDVGEGAELAAIQVAQLTPHLRLSAAGFIVI